MNENYKKLLDTTETIYNYKNSEKLFNTLNVIAQLMVEMENNTLKNATLLAEYKHERLKIKIQVDKHAPYS